MALAVCSHVVCEKCDRVLSKLYAAAERARIIARIREEAEKHDEAAGYGLNVRGDELRRMAELLGEETT